MIFSLQLLLYRIGGIFIYINYDQQFWPYMGNLPAQLAAYGASAACYKDHLIFDQLCGLVRKDNRISAQQIFHLYIGYS